MKEVARLIKSPAYKALPDTEDFTTAGNRRTKKDAIQEIITRYKRPVTERINRQARRRAAIAGTGGELGVE